MKSSVWLQNFISINFKWLNFIDSILGNSAGRAFARSRRTMCERRRNPSVWLRWLRWWWWWWTIIEWHWRSNGRQQQRQYAGRQLNGQLHIFAAPAGTGATPAVGSITSALAGNDRMIQPNVGSSTPLSCRQEQMDLVGSGFGGHKWSDRPIEAVH